MPMPSSRASRLARPSDASYLDLAMRLGLPIATQDAHLANAAKTCRVPTFDPSTAQGSS